MSQKVESNRTSERSERHFTTRRGFIGALSFGVVSLYGVWAAYGAAPTSLGFLSRGLDAGEGGMAGMGHGGGGLSVEEFRRLTEAFIEANELLDGSVKPIHHAMVRMSAPPAHGGGHEPAAQHDDENAGAPAGGHAEEDGGESTTRHGQQSDDGHGGEARGMAMAGRDDHYEDEPEALDVYLMASRYGYDPSLLRLEPNVAYKFRMMAVDANHGASINVRLAGHMIRCPARTLVEKVLTFSRPGEYMVYCTVFCGEGHDVMMGKIVVA